MSDNECFIFTYYGPDKYTVLGDVQGIVFLHPYMAVNTSPFIKPALILAGIGTNNQDVLFPEPDVIGHVETEFRISAHIASHIMPVEPHFTITEHTIEADPDSFATVGFRERESPAVPSYGAFGEDTSRRLESMAQHIFVIAFYELLLHHPVVGKVKRPPCRIVEIGRHGTVSFAGLGKEGGGAVTKIFFCG